jgi:predicted DNA-binding transcriptional regulator YafY
LDKTENFKTVSVNRIDRLHAILTHLQSKKLVTAQEIADRFNISLRTVYRDIKALDESGVPVIGEAGNGYSIMEGYRLPPVMFTQEEASALLLGSKLAEQLTDTSIRKHLDAALFKIKAVLRSADKEYVEHLDEHVAVFRSALPVDEQNDKYLVQMQKAIVEKRVMYIEYVSNYNDEFTKRNIEPIGLCYYGQSWHLIGWCQLRNDYRDFRINRIKQLRVTEGSFVNRQHRSLQQYINDVVHGSAELQEVVVEFDNKVARHITDQKYYYGFVREERLENTVRMFFVTAYLQQFGRWMLMFTNSVKIVSPAKLRDLMQELTEELSEHYKFILSSV